MRLTVAAIALCLVALTSAAYVPVEKSVTGFKYGRLFSVELIVSIYINMFISFQPTRNFW